jgi:acetyl esterase/lipase
MKNSPLRRALLALLLLPATILPANQSKEIPLWPNGAPGSEGKSGPEAVRLAENGERVVSNVHQPSITPYLPPKEKATGAAVIIAPGGGHRELWTDHEGHNVARYLSARGVAAFVLKYRLAREANSTYTVDDHALADAAGHPSRAQPRAGVECQYVARRSDGLFGGRRVGGASQHEFRRR